MGDILLKTDELKQFIVINQIGISLYSYDFDQLYEKNSSSENKSGDEGKTLMFSGAIKAVSSLLSELTGIQQNLREIVLNKTVMIVYHSPDSQYSFVLILDISLFSLPPFYHTSYLIK